MNLELRGNPRCRAKGGGYRHIVSQASIVSETPNDLSAEMNVPGRTNSGPLERRGAGCVEGRSNEWTLQLGMVDEWSAGASEFQVTYLMIREPYRTTRFAFVHALEAWCCIAQSRTLDLAGAIAAGNFVRAWLVAGR